MLLDSPSQNNSWNCRFWGFTSRLGSGAGCVAWLSSVGSQTFGVWSLDLEGWFFCVWPIPNVRISICDRLYRCTRHIWSHLKWADIRHSAPISLTWVWVFQSLFQLWLRHFQGPSNDRQTHSQHYAGWRLDWTDLDIASEQHHVSPWSARGLISRWTNYWVDPGQSRGWWLHMNEVVIMYLEECLVYSS